MALHSRRETYISLYTGGGGLDLGFQLANPAAVPILYVEREIHAAALLVDHIQAGILDEAPVWSDSGTLDCKPFVDQVDWIIGGFPCQPWSAAGKRSGIEDPRWLWPHIARMVREIRPERLFLENVPGLLSGGIEHVLGDLAEMGFSSEWGSVKASDVSAPHRRERTFIYAYKQLGDSSPHRWYGWGSTESSERENSIAGICGEVANTRSISGEVSQASKPDRTNGRTTTGPSREFPEELAHSAGIISERVEREGTARGKSKTKTGNRSRDLADTNDTGIPASERDDQRKGSPGSSEGQDGFCAESRGYSEPLGHPGHDARKTESGQQQDAGREYQTARVRESGENVGNSDRPGQRQGDPQDPGRSSEQPVGGSCELADTSSSRREGSVLRRSNGSEGWQESDGRAATSDGTMVDPIGERGRGRNFGREYAADAFPPGPEETEKWRSILREAPELAPALESSVRGVVDGMAPELGKAATLRILGNGVVPQQAAYGFMLLEKQILKRLLE